MNSKISSGDRLMIDEACRPPVHSRRPLEEALDELAIAIDRMGSSLEKTMARLLPVTVSEQVTDEGLSAILGAAEGDHSVVVYYIKGQIHRLDQLTCQLNSLYDRLEV